MNNDLYYAVKILLILLGMKSMVLDFTLAAPLALLFEL